MFDGRLIGTVNFEMEHNLARVWASTDLRHVRSQRVMERLGMARETVRAGAHVGRDGVPVDEVVYALDVTTTPPSGSSA